MMPEDSATIMPTLISVIEQRGTSLENWSSGLFIDLQNGN
jgi:hypothetical protein